MEFYVGLENYISPWKVIEIQWKSLENINLKKLDIFHLSLSRVFCQQSLNG